MISATKSELFTSEQASLGNKAMTDTLAQWKSKVIFQLGQPSEYEVFAKFVSLASELGYSKVAYGLEFPNSVVRPDFCYFSNFSSDWQTAFALDATLPMSAKSAIGKRTTSKDDLGSLAPHWVRDDFAREATVNGVRFAWLQLVPGYAGTTSTIGLAGENEYPNGKTADCIRALVDLVAMNMTAHLVPKILPQSTEAITPTERACLQWVLDGKTALEIADILGTKESSIRHLQVKLRTMFGKGSIFATAVLAYRMGLLTDSGDCLGADILGASSIMLGISPCES